jgi:methionine-rich copper-binding protein CopC
MSRVVSRALLTVPASVVALLLATAGPALAHNELKSSDPADGTTVSTTPGTVTLTFNETLDVDHTQVTVTGPNGAPAAPGKPRFAGDAATVDLPPGPAGIYTVSYSTVADDGDKSGGTIRFTVTTGAAAPGAPAPTGGTTEGAAATTASGGWVPWAIGGAIVALAAAVVAAVAGRRTKTGA